MTGIEDGVTGIIHGVRFSIEIISALLVVGGVLTALAMLARARLTPGSRYEQGRYRLSRYLVLALEFQLASDILGTALEPSWEQLGKLGTVAVIRTFLNYFLTREMMEMEQGRSTRENI